MDIPRRYGLFKRKFENGMVFVNTNLLFSISTGIEPGYRHINGVQDTNANNGSCVELLTIGPSDGVILIKE